MATEQKSVASVADELQERSSAWQLIETLMEGTAAMRAAGQQYLPQFPKEDTKAYRARLMASVLFPAFKRTVIALAGKPFSKPLTVGDDVPARIKGWLDDVDLQGRNMHTFASTVFQTAMAYGGSGILVEYPVVRQVTTQVLSQADEAAMQLRPYLVEIKPSQLLGWRVVRVNGAWALAQLRFKECVTEPDGPYGEKEIEQIRVLMPKTWEIHRQNEKDEWVLFDSGVNTLGAVPYVPIYTDRDEFMVSCPPLLELAHLNVKHWQSDSDQTNILHVARVPILAALGVEDTYELVVGAQAATKLPAGADLKYVEHTGAAIEAGRQDIKDLEERMRQTGAELLVLAPGQVTASQVISEDATTKCLLQSYVEQFEDSLDTTLGFMALWAKEAGGGHVELFKDFGAATLAETSSKLLLDMNLAGKLSDESLYGELQRRGVIAPDTTWEDEQQRLADQGPLPGSSNPNPDPTKPNPAPVE